jgi:hypothetical protein
MALDTATALRIQMASAPQATREITVFSFAHSLMTRTWHVWREPYVGEVTLETEAVVEVLPVNVVAELAGTPANLDRVYRIAMGTVDIEDEFRREMDLIPYDDDERVQVDLRLYLSDDLADVQAHARLQLESCIYQRGNAGLIAASPRLNLTRTGEIYSVREVPMLRGFR